MKIKTLYLKNWQRHSDLVIDFNDSINIISGLSDVGKSSIRRAIEWVCFNSTISETDYRKENTSETSVKIDINNNISIERIRSNSINRYILSSLNYEDKIFDSFGKEIPDEIKEVIESEVIQIDNDKLNLNIAEQLTLPFLLDKSASFRAKLFNKLTGNEVLDKLFKEFNKEGLRVNREIKSLEETIEEQENQLSEYSTKYKNIKHKLNIVQKSYNKIEEDVEIYQHLKDISDKLQNNSENKELLDFKLSKIKTISNTKIKNLLNDANKFEEIKNISNKLKDAICDLKDIQIKKKCIKIPNVDFTKLKCNNDSFQQLIDINNKINKNKEAQEDISNTILKIKETLKTTEKELKNVWEQCDVCPLCKMEKKHE